MNKILFIGAIDQNEVATNGVTKKNQVFIARLKELNLKVITIDTWMLSKHPFNLLRLAFYLLFKSRFIIIMSGGHSASRLISLINKLPGKSNVHFFAAGGTLHLAVADGLYDIEALKNLTSICVEGEAMVSRLNKLGLNNVRRITNFREIPEIKLGVKEDNTRVNFVFMSRVHPEKGCDMILNCCERLNTKGLVGLYSVDFYGPIFEEYEVDFLNRIQKVPNALYRGFLDLSTLSGYTQMSTYDAMLFPTFWGGEGFPGAVIDAYIAGVPIIASDWNMNNEVILENQTGLVIPAKDEESLYQVMLKIIRGELDMSCLKDKCKEYSRDFDYRNVLSEEVLKELNII